jgi:DNA-binding response OmpR family regulator
MTFRILLADTDKGLLDRYREFLSGQGFEVATATTALDCVEQLRTFRPHVLVLEPDLPWGWGEGVIARMREEADLPLVPVILLTVRRDKDGLCASRDFPIRACHVKPVSPTVLARSIEALAPDNGGPYGLATVN